MAARFPEAGEALSFCICEQPFRLAAATAVSELQKSSWGQEAIRTEERQRGDSGGDGKKVREREGVMVGPREKHIQWQRQMHRDSKSDGGTTEIQRRERRRRRKQGKRV